MTDFREDGAAALEWAARYLEQVPELPVLAQVAWRDRAVEFVQGVLRMGNEDHRRAHDDVTLESGRDLGAYSEVHGTVHQRLRRSRYYRFDQLDPRVRGLAAEAL